MSLNRDFGPIYFPCKIIKQNDKKITFNLDEDGNVIGLTQYQ